MSSTPDPPRAQSRTGVIHDLGYRPYAGPRQAEPLIARALFVTGLRNAFGLGRSGKSKILPFILLGLNLVPALILVTVMVTLRLKELPTDYAAYAGTTQMLVSVFAAAQAPILFSHDLRYGSIVLYLARPMHAATYAVTRWASLVAALLVFLLTPVLVLYVGALLAGTDVTDQSRDAGIAALLATLLAGMLAAVAGLISSWSTRRGFAVVATIAVLLFGYGVIAAIQGIAHSQDQLWVGEYAGLLSPYSLYRGLAESLADVSAGSITPPTGAAMEAGYLVVALALVVGGAGALVLRYRRVAGR
ncbi:MAG TPA: ABC transporter permease [Nocardioides sp.]|uniref:ABC transporter permease n=1 Tax=Nocardioides sp. TaxID=35761 RepID=UPI002B70C44A|nr:ABC transporter permease [Nocardioides sp.]HQR28157.1 ABC transporter permease [Nocardioides sp.]